MRGDLILLGGGGHSIAVIDVIERAGDWMIAGVIDPQLPSGALVGGYPVLGSDDALPALGREIGHAIVTVGQIQSATVRMRLYRRLLDCGFALPTIVSPLAEVSRRATIGAGTTVMHFAAVGPEASIGVNTILNSRALVEHGSRVGNHCHVATGALVNGTVTVGDGCFIGSGSVVKEGVTIGAGCLVGMGCRLRHDLANGERFLERSA